MLIDVRLCDDDGYAYEGGYPCTGGAHIVGVTVRCTSPAHASKAGPSDGYRALLAGRITPDEYVASTKADVDARLANGDTLDSLDLEPEPDGLLARLRRLLSRA